MGDKSPIKRKETLKRKLNTKGCCFLCVKLVDIKSEGSENKETLLTSPTTKCSVSLKSLNRYLQINSNTVTGGSSATPKDSTTESAPTKNEEEIEVELCQSCKKIINQLSNLLSLLEKTQLEVNYWLGRINLEISEASKQPEIIQNYSKRMTSDSESLSQLVFVDNLRKEISNKSKKMTVGLELKVELSRLQPNDLRPSASLPRGNSTTTMPSNLLQWQSLENLDEENEDASWFPDYEDKDVKGEGETNGHLPSIAVPSSPSFSEGKSEPLVGSGIASASCTKSFPMNLKMGTVDCSEYSKKFSKRSDLSRHYNSVHLKRKYKCEICNIAVFTESARLNQHKKTCKDTFKDRLAKINQQKTDPRYKYICPTCGKRYTFRYNLVKHNKRVHLKERKYACDLCSKTFNESTVLNEHKSVYHNGKRFYCKYCKKSFMSKSSCLYLHQKKCEKNVKLVIKTEIE